MPLALLLDKISENLTLETLDLSYNYINLIYKHKV